jgi:malonate-semialdehyde dehydrogenase (acetylating) / methylmalonate-semialdehyde dehydrogenase
VHFLDSSLKITGSFYGKKFFKFFFHVIGAPDLNAAPCCFLFSFISKLLLSISKDMDTYSIRLPLGVTAGICPFNFPAMVPLWMFPLALVTGNTMILKPSEQDPGATMKLVELAKVNLCIEKPLYGKF